MWGHILIKYFEILRVSLAVALADVNFQGVIASAYDLYEDGYDFQVTCVTQSHKATGFQG